MKHLPLIRKICQIAVLALFCALPFVATLGFSGVRGSLFSLDIFGLPFADPASSLQISGQGLATGAFPASEILIGAGLSLLLAFLCGRVFCGWLCPYGLLSELVGRRKRSWKYALRLKTAIFIAALLLASFLGYPLLTWLSMPGQISLAPMAMRQDWSLALLILLPPLLAILLDFILGRRFFCSSFCPQSVLLGACAHILPKSLPALRIRWDKDRCSCKDAPCEKVCQLALKPRKKLPRGQCHMCGECIAVCARHGKALSFSVRD